MSRTHWIKSMQGRHADQIPNAKKEQSDTKQAAIAKPKDDVGASPAPYAPCAPSNGYRKLDEPYNGMLDFLAYDMGLSPEQRERETARALRIETDQADVHDRIAKVQESEAKRRARMKKRAS